MNLVQPWKFSGGLMCKQKTKTFLGKMCTFIGGGSKTLAEAKTVTGKNWSPWRTEMSGNARAFFARNCLEPKHSTFKICYMPKKCEDMPLGKISLERISPETGASGITAGYMSALLSYLTYSLLFSSVTGMFLPLGLSSCWRNLPKALCSTQNVWSRTDVMSFSLQNKWKIDSEEFPQKHWLFSRGWRHVSFRKEWPDLQPDYNLKWISSKE